MVATTYPCVSMQREIGDVVVNAMMMKSCDGDACLVMSESHHHKKETAGVCVVQVKVSAFSHGDPHRLY